MVPLPDKSACPVVCPVKAGMFSGEQTCRGRSQSPVVWIAAELETEPSKPIEKTSRRKTRVLDFDLRAYFDNVRYDRLLGKVAQRVKDADIMHLLKVCLLYTSDAADE